MHALNRPALQDTDTRRHYVRSYRAVIFDMDGVVTDTAQIHALAWKELFDDALPKVGALPANVEATTANPDRLRQFDLELDYLHYVDGKPREDGVRSFFASRGLEVPEADEAEASGADPQLTVDALAERKQAFFETVLERDGVAVFPETLALLDELRAQEIPTALVTSSRNSSAVLTAGGVQDYFDVIVDGNTALEHGIPGKPAPQMFLTAAAQLEVEPQDAIVLEDAVSGVQASHAGDFGLVVGVDRANDRQRLLDAGADVVVADISVLHLHRRVTKPFDANWVLRYDDFDPTQEGTREALCTLANGYWGTRGSIPGTVAGDVHYPGTYLAGVFNRLTSSVQGREVETEHMVNTADWTVMTVTPTDGAPLLPTSAELLEYRQDLDLRRGLLTRTARYRDLHDRVTRVTTRQFQSMAGHHLAALELTVEAENWSGDVTVRSVIDGRVANQNVADDRQLAAVHLATVGSRELDGHTVLLETETNQSEVRIATATRTRVFSPEPGQPEPIRRPVEDSDSVVGHDISVHLEQGSPVRIEKVVAVATSRDHAASTVWHNAAKRVARAGSFRTLLTFHDEAWGINWQRFAVELDQPADGTPNPQLSRAQLALNLHTFHVLQTSFGSRRELDAGLGARGLHGEGYRGHIFWDEMYMYPMLTLRRPSLTRGLLMYRFRRLGEAREMARQEGYAGAMFPWQSGSDGREETPTELWNPRSQMWMPDNSHNQRHVSLAVAYSVLRYFEASHDEAFMSDYGAEMLVEICRFFASMAFFNEESGRWEIHGVMGPDEYHDGYPETPGSGLRNNAYTNVLTSWMLTQTAELLRWMDGRGDPLSEWLDVFSDELDQWDRIASGLKIAFIDHPTDHGVDHIMSQFEGYEDLLEFDWDAYRERYGNIGRLDLILQAEGDATNRYKLSKQADTLMLTYLFSAQELTEILENMGYSFDAEDFNATVEYYLARTSHGSTLSRLVHGWVSSWGDPEKSWELFTEALESDLSDIQGGTTREGIHLGLMAGTVDMVIRCYAGVETRDEVLRINPVLPEALPGVSFALRFHRQPVEVHITHDEVRVHLREGSSAPIKLMVEGREKLMSPGEDWTVPLLHAANQKKRKTGNSITAGEVTP
ncbi:beta-phosphoglucomutase family hydrolase [Citricoccus muralis]|uniref:Beta-phosphoglucomutase family hydrolase n=1 Tax=Citricoccus muralis TaxID=169134 RepID=A0ABY8H5L2_9MICC|nr:beta-phosphoglucomutase family hydrolase [Citricoccus muralis]WFP16418.1 beta-phosphoglucomutase family hydrolase [Citricoccus muralis]